MQNFSDFRSQLIHTLFMQLRLGCKAGEIDNDLPHDEIYLH
jgi:hypothetical protein